MSLVENWDDYLVEQKAVMKAPPLVETKAFQVAASRVVPRAAPKGVQQVAVTAELLAGH